jgi:hypothetical protein
MNSRHVGFRCPLTILTKQIGLPDLKRRQPVDLPSSEGMNTQGKCCASCRIEAWAGMVPVFCRFILRTGKIDSPGSAIGGIACSHAPCPCKRDGTELTELNDPPMPP